MTAEDRESLRRIIERTVAERMVNLRLAMGARFGRDEVRCRLFIDYLRRGLDVTLAPLDGPRSLRAETEATRLRLDLEVNQRRDRGGLTRVCTSPDVRPGRPSCQMQSDVPIVPSNDFSS